MHPRNRRRRSGGTALLAALAITGLPAALAGCGVGDAASERAANRAITSSTAQSAGIELRTLPVAHIAYIPEIPRQAEATPVVRPLAATNIPEAVSAIR